MLSRCDSDQLVADGLMGPSVTLGPVGSYGMLSWCNSDQPVADGLVGPYIALSPVGSYGMLSQCDSDQLAADGPVGPSVTLGPVGSYGMLSRCNSDHPVADGLVGPYVALGPVGSYGMLSRCDSGQLIADGPVVPYETLSRCDFDQHDADGPVGPSTTRGPVGPYGMQSRVTLTLILFHPVVDGMVGSSGMLSPCNSSTPDPADQYVDNDSVMTEAEVDQTDGSIATVVSSGGGYESGAWDSGYQREIIDGVTVYFGGDLCDSDDLDWEDPEDTARREYVDQYNFD